MTTPTIVIEPTDSAIKIVVGYVLNKQPVVLYATTKKIKGLIRNGNIIDIKSLSSLYRKISRIEDKDAKVRFDIRSAVLVLPPIEMEIYEDKKTTSVISNNNIIDRIDIRNVVMMISKGKIKPGNSFVDIIPTKFYLSDGMIDKLPLGLKSSFLSMKAIIYTLPTKLLNGYKISLESSGIKTRRCVIAPCAMAHLINNDRPYIYVDVGSSYTSISLINKTFVYGSTYFSVGGNNLTYQIAEKFNIDHKEAEKIKRRYGYNTRIISFDPIIASSKGPSDQEITYTVRNLNEIIQDYFENFIYNFDNSLNKLLSAYPENKRDFPIIVGGAASRLNGFVELFRNRYQRSTVSEVPLNVVGTRHQQYLNCLGALMATSKYQGSMEDQVPPGANRLKR